MVAEGKRSSHTRHQPRRGVWNTPPDAPAMICILKYQQRLDLSRKPSKLLQQTCDIRENQAGKGSKFLAPIAARH